MLGLQTRELRTSYFDCLYTVFFVYIQFVCNLREFYTSAKKFGQVKRRFIRRNTSVNAESERVDVNTSKKKIVKGEGSFKDYEDNFSVETQSRYVIIDLNMLKDIFNNIAKCRYCDKSFCFDVSENKNSCKGLATSVSITCKYCGSGHASNTMSDGYEVNLRFVYGI
ncbi:hypothetical protein TNCV_4217361 [Trichonephila clavipes]|nr:hypothetical protein TNCV_4217361 [Trichonephila clavipes]